jgi:glycosyltransferase involved in cell wall biosynthesis
VRILVVSQMYPGPEDPDLGVFVADLVDALRLRGHDVELAVIDRRSGGKRRYLELREKTSRARRPDVVWAHFLVPAGLIATRVDAPLVVTAHGRDVRNIGTLPGIAALTRIVVRRAATVIAVSDYLRRELELRIPAARGKTVVIDSGVDLDRFRPDGKSQRLRHAAGPAFVAVGTLTERKNGVRLADAFVRLGRGSLTFVGDGPLRAQLEVRERVVVTGRVPHVEVADYVRGADVVCAPSLVEPFGQSILEGMAAAKTVVATRLGGPSEFVPPEAGLLVDPLDVSAIGWALEAALAFPAPNEAARAAAATHDLSLQAERVESVLLRAARGRPA